MPGLIVYEIFYALNLDVEGRSSKNTENWALYSIPTYILYLHYCVHTKTLFLVFVQVDVCNRVSPELAAEEQLIGRPLINYY